ncbi:MAG: cation:proton antiporter [Deltaproteobacteria bacterium]|nr:cation:proton antiporter [Deltaproteobacteria bacterium]
MKGQGRLQKNMGTYVLTLALLVLFALWIKSVAIESSWHHAGWINFSLGFVLLTAFVSAKILKFSKLPMISGYILTGIIAGPYVTSFLTFEMVTRLKLIDDLALNFIGLSAGAALHLPFLKERSRAIFINVLFLTLVVLGLVLLFVMLTGGFFSFTRNLSYSRLLSLAILLGVASVARSPSSAMAIINETRAKGIFTDTVLGVTVAMDVLVILLFTIAMSVCGAFLTGGEETYMGVFSALFIELGASLAIGALIGKGISFYFERAGYNPSLFILFMAFCITKFSAALSHFMEVRYGESLHLEPLLICMSAGFFVQNFSKAGTFFVESLDRSALPIYVLFFSLAGAALNIEALRICWPIAVGLAIVRIAGIFVATWLAGTINRDSTKYRYTSWMAYITQAGVAIGLAQLAQRQFPEIGLYLATIVLAVIAINQVIGPVTFKVALGIVGEINKDD